MFKPREARRKEEGNSKPDRFRAERDIIEPKGGKIRIEFTFCCYPKDHRPLCSWLRLTIS